MRVAEAGFYFFFIHERELIYILCFGFQGFAVLPAGTVLTLTFSTWKLTSSLTRTEQVED